MQALLDYLTSWPGMFYAYVTGVLIVWSVLVYKLKILSGSPTSVIWAVVFAFVLAVYWPMLAPFFMVWLGLSFRLQTNPNPVNYKK